MLTRKQMWRRVRGGGRVVDERFTSKAEPSAESKAREAPEAPRASSDTADSRGRKVTFNYVVRIVLVPCSKELRPLNAQLWWGADDYLDFRRQYVHAVRSAAAAAAAAAASQPQEEQQQPLPPHPKGPPASADLDAASQELGADEPTEPKTVVEPPPTSPPSPVSSASLATPLPSTKQPPAVAATPGAPTAAATVATSGGHQQQEVFNGRVLSASGTARCDPKKRQVLSRPPRLDGPLPPLSSSRSCVVNTTKKWTPSAGMVAAKAAAEAEEEGYRTESMSSASDSSWSSGDSSEADSDDDSHQAHRGPVFWRGTATRCSGSSSARASDVRVISESVGNL